MVFSRNLILDDWGLTLFYAQKARYSHSILSYTLSTTPEPPLKGLVAVRVNFDCFEVFYWIQRGRKPRSSNSENRNIKDPLWHVSTSLSWIFIPIFLDTRWSQRGITFTYVVTASIESPPTRQIFCPVLYLHSGTSALIPPRGVITPAGYLWKEE